MEINCVSGHSLEAKWLSGWYFHPPRVEINCALWMSADGPQQKIQYVKIEEIEKTQWRQWEKEYTETERERFSQGGRITRRKTRTDRERENEREEKLPEPNRKSVLTPAVWKLKPFKGFFFFSSIQLTKNALTYQTRAQWGLCPHITDFLLRANGKTRSFVSTLSGPTNLFLITGCMWGLQDYWYIVFPFTRIAACIWSNIDTTWTQRKSGKRLKREIKKNMIFSHALQ